MHEQLFASSTRPADTYVLGLPLLEFSIGHKLELLASENPLLCDPAFFDTLPADQREMALRKAVLICSHDESDRRSAPESFVGYLFDRLKQWFFFKVWNFKQYGFRFRRWSTRQPCFALETVQFRIYLDAAHESFPWPEKHAEKVVADTNGYESSADQRGRSFGAPETARLLNFITDKRLHTAYGYRNPFDFPYAFANHLYLTHLETTGCARIENQAEYDEGAHIAKLEAEIAAEARERKLKTPAPKQPAGLATAPPDLEATTEETLTDPSHLTRGI